MDKRKTIWKVINGASSLNVQEVKNDTLQTDIFESGPN